MRGASLTVAGRLYVVSIVLAGIGVIAASAWHLVMTRVDPQWFALAVLAILSGAAILRLRLVPTTFSIGDTFSFAALFLYGPEAATVIVALDTLAISLRLHRNLNFARLFFNATAPAFAMWLAGRLFASEFTAGTLSSGILRSLGYMAATATLFFVLNSGFVAIAVAFEGQKSPLKVWRDHFLSLWVGPLTGAYVGGLLAFFVRETPGPAVILLLPIPLILYVAFRTWLGRVDADIQHLADLERAYTSMIRALASAIDSRDQITHGHLQRVQFYAVALARALGVHDEREIRAIEAAALLHDLGKIGIPDEILNKPGKLTAGEFEVMKRHVNIGADILAEVDFPYPMLPIVRAHHEFWNGQGYPDGLRGAAIPLGARILAVVDCFDALTSDRPYRRQLSVTEAFGIINERRGVIYDPAVVDMFMRIQPTLELPDAYHPPVDVLFENKVVPM